MIKAILVFNNHGKPRLSKFYQYFVSNFLDMITVCMYVCNVFYTHDGQKIASFILSPGCKSARNFNMSVIYNMFTE